ncbi:MAG: hypothetical protein ACK4M9_03460 [Anaerobacillus sp.]|uniref:hypothetical protein n=1 Tax=Anaerobacillus sp. TaxID=1872506 RepID=UPI00391BDB2F
MKRIFRIQMLFLILLLVVSACASNPDFELYEGRALKIAVIGETPKVIEEHIKFVEIKFDDLFDKELKYYDAIFIMEENLKEASQSQYADIYLHSTTPFFFIGATKSYLSFVEDDITYESDKELKEISNHYAIGYLSSKNGEDKYWYYGLYNDQFNERNIKEMYSRIFMTASTNY